MAKIFNSDQLQVKYVSSPGLNGGGANGGIITFSGEKISSVALLMEQCSVSFTRNLVRKFFLNTSGVGYLMGLGTGQLTIQGLLGKAEDFATVFGLDSNNPCKNVHTVVLNVNGMHECGNNNTKSAPGGKLTLTGVIPAAIRIDTQVDQNGTLYYNASASFEFTGLDFD